MALLPKREPLPPVPPQRRLAALESEIAEFTRTEVRRAPLSSNMKASRDFLANGLSDAYRDGAKALQDAIDKCEQQVSGHEALVAQERNELNSLKAQAAQILLAHREGNSKVATDMEAHLNYMHAMAEWMEKHYELISHPPQTAQPLQLTELVKEMKNAPGDIDETGREKSDHE